MAAEVARLEIADVSVRWGDVVAVDAVDLAVAAGEVVALLGPSGCGKSSLLTAIAGLVPCGGRVSIDGEDVTARRPDQRDLGLMFQHGALFPHLDVAANVAFGLRMHGWERGRRDQRVAEVLDLVGLGGLGVRRVDQLSGGQAQRVALARAIAPQPRLLLLDEPLSSLDARLRDHLLEELPRVFAAVDAAVVHVTHDQDEAMALADRVAVMQDGRIVRLDTPVALWHDPGSVFVARFLGWRNVFATSAAGDLPVVALPDRVLDALGRPAVVGVDAGRVDVVARSTDAGRAGDATRWDGVITDHHFAGDHVSVDVAVSGSDLVVRATGPVHAMPERGAEVATIVLDDAWRVLRKD